MIDRGLGSVTVGGIVDKRPNTDHEGYPEMLREITAFVLLKVNGKEDNRVMDELYQLEQVREIHSIHGDVDVLVKVVLVRDLLLSDAEIVSNFVHQNVRRLDGVVSTQTLIPGRSATKT